jgi:hypothetical protein
MPEVGQPHGTRAILLRVAELLSLRLPPQVRYALFSQNVA